MRFESLQMWKQADAAWEPSDAVSAHVAVHKSTLDYNQWRPGSDANRASAHLIVQFHRDAEPALPEVVSPCSFACSEYFFTAARNVVSAEGAGTFPRRMSRNGTNFP